MFFHSARIYEFYHNRDEYETQDCIYENNLHHKYYK